MSTNRESIKIEMSSDNKSNENDIVELGALDVLVFDDNPMDFELIKIHLRSIENLTLHYASNFELFKTLLIEKNYSAIVCDFDLGMMDAIEVYDYLNQKNLRVPFIVVSGAQGEEKAVEILKTGVTDYVLKDKFDKMPFVLTRAIKEHEAQIHEQYMLERLKESETKFREIFNSIIDVYFQSDLNGVQKVISPSVETVIGYKPEEIIGGKAADLYHDPNQRNVFLATLLETGSIADFEITLVCKDGSFKDISTNAKIVYDENGEALGIHGVYRDISEKKKQHSLLVKREAQLREAQIMANLGSWEINLETKNIVLSDEFFQIFELPVDNKIRKDFYEFGPLIHPEDRGRLESNMIKFMKTGNKLPYEFRIVTNSGKLKYISTKVFKSKKGDQSDYIAGIIQDITDLKLLEEEKNNVQRQALEMLEEMVEQRTMKIEEQRTVIEQKNRDITDSIRYAKQVQMAIMPHKEFIDSYLPQNFLFYLPKDIVAGDFYWSYANEDNFMMAVADCTGHGVPGALVSVICYNALNRAVNEYGLTVPGEILDKVNSLVIDFFSRGSGEIKDGMDISLVVIDFSKRKLRWAGANNPLVYFDGGETKKVIANKNAIGTPGLTEGYTTHYIPYINDTTYYLFSDGYADQFGGKNNKKFMQKRLMALMELANKKAIVHQEDLFVRTFHEWKGENEQVDDIAFFAFKLP